MLGLVLVPGLLAAGIGMLTFVGLDNLTGFGTFSLAIPGVPPFDRPTLALFGWAIVFGLLAPILGRGIQLLAVAVRARVEPRMVLLMPVVGLGIAGLAIGFGEATGHSASNVLFSGQDDLGPMIGGAAGWSAGALVLLVLCKGLAYALALGVLKNRAHPVIGRERPALTMPIAASWPARSASSASTGSSCTSSSSSS